jgi:spore coat protein SA
LKVGILINPITVIDPQRVGGVERVGLYELDCLNKKGIQAQLYVRGFKGRNPNIRAIKNFDYNKDLGRLYYSWFVEENLESDILHGMNTPLLGLFSKSCKASILIHLHNVTVLPYSSIAAENYQKSFFAFCSSFLRRDFLKRNQNIPRENCFTLYNGVDIEKFTPPKSSKNNGKPTLFFTGCWNQAKGVFVFLRAIKTLEKRRKDFHVILGGSPYIYDTGSPKEWQTKAEKKVLSLVRKLKSVSILGLVDYNELAKVYQSTDIFVNPVIWQEPFGLVNIEAMATGLPVIGSKVGGIPEIIVDGKTGLLVPPNDIQALVEAIESLLEDEKLRVEMGREGRQRVENLFTWETHVNKLISLYQLMLDLRIE